VAVLLTISVFALVGANAGILRGTQLERILQGIVRKVPQLGLFLSDKKEEDDKNG
jgi:hypothetical protein